MTTIKIFMQNDKIQSVSAVGHSGYGNYGSDILCASISAIVQTAGLGIKTLVSQDVILFTDENKPEFKITLPDNLSNFQYSQAKLILDTCILGLKDLQSGYPKNIKLEVKNDVY